MTVADVLTVSRMLCSLLLTALPVRSGIFAALYLFCGVSDVLDGFLARRLHTESERGAKLDSAADLLFALAYAVKLLPELALPAWLWGWTAGIAAAKLAGILIRSRLRRGFDLPHSPLNRLTGLAIFLLPLFAQAAAVKFGAAFVCALATAATVAENCGGWTCGRRKTALSQNRPKGKNLLKYGGGYSTMRKN